MKSFISCFLLLSTLSIAHAKTECTTEPVAKWKDQKAFQKELEATYKIKKFKVTPENCYEIYGWDKAGKKVEIYFNPVTGEAVNQK